MVKFKINKSKILSKNLFPVVGIGASAGGLEAFKKLVKAIPGDSGMAYILVQHLHPDRSSALPEILQRETRVPVSEISNNEKVEPDHVYVIPSNKMLVATDGILQLSSRPSKDQENMSIDIFFTSLAEVHQRHAIDIVLSGNGADGTEGLRNIKEQGGITFAEDPGSNTYDSMPQNAIQAGVADFIFSPENMPRELLKFLRDKQRTQMIFDQTHLASIVNASNDGIICQTLDGIITSWNLRAEKIFGYLATEAIGRGISMIVPPYHLKEESQFLESIKKGEPIQHFETIRLTKTGTRVDVSLTISPLTDNRGKVIGAATIVYEISERKQVEEKLKQSELRLKQAQAIAHIGSWDLNFKTGIAIWSDEQLSIYGLRPEEYEQTNKSWMSFVHPEDKDYVAKKVSEIKSDLKNLVYYYRIIRKDGTIRHLCAQNQIKYNAEGLPIGLHGVVQDVTETKKAERALRESEANMQAIFENTSEGFILADSKGIIKSFNNRSRDRIWLNTEQEIKVGDSVFDFIHESKKDLYKDGISKILAGEVLHYDYPYTRKNGETKWFNFTVNPVYNYGKVDSLSITSSDITQRKTDENKLIISSGELQKALTDLNKIMDSSLDVICIVNGNGEFVKVSKASQLVWGYTPEELIGTKYMNLVYDEDVDNTSKAAEKVANNIPVPIFENRDVHKSGKLVPMLWSVNWDDQLQLMFCIGKDVTEKKRLEKAVENERDQFYDMFLNAPSAIGMLKGADHVFEMANPLYLQLTGKKEVIGKTVAAVFPEMIEQGFIGILDHVYVTGKAYTGKEALIKIDKEGNGELTDTYANFIYQAYRNNEGKIEGIFFFANDITEQILARKEIEKSEKSFKGVVENSDDMITMLDPAGKTIYASASVSKKFGYTNEECLNINIADILHPDDALIMQEFVMKMMMHPGVPMECPLIRERKKDGTYIWVEGILTNFLETEGINAVVANFRDVTERKKAVELIVRSEANLNAIIENTEASIYSLDQDLRYITFNNILYNSQKQIYGLEIKPGDNVYNFLEKLSPDEASEWKEVYAKALKGETVKFEKEIRNDDYHSYIDFSIHPIWENKNVIGLSCFAIDITKQKKANEKNKFKARLLNTIGQAAVATDINGIIIYWNQAAEDIYGWTKEEALGKNIIDLTPSEASTEQANQLMEELKKGRTWSGEFKVRKKNGASFPAMIYDSPIYDENNILSGIIGISYDITEKKKLEELLDKSNRLAVIGSWEIDVDKGTVYWSDITKEIREVDKDFVPQLDIGISYFKEGSHKEIISQKVKECIENGTPWDEELEIITFKGNRKWVRTIGEGEFSNGKCKRVYGSFQDINARKLAEIVAIQISEEKNIILESIGDGFFAVDTNWVVTYWNNQSEKMLHRSSVEMIGKNLLEVYSHNIDSLFHVNFKKAIKENLVQHFESYSENLETWYEVSAYPSASGLSVYFKDITQRKLAEQQIKEDKNLLRTLIDHLPDTIYYKDKSAKKLISNKFDYTVLGADTEEEVLGKTDLEISSHPNALMTYAQDMEILNTGKPLINFEEYFTTADNNPLWLLTSKLPLRNENNEIIGLLGIGRDITQRKIAEEKLLEVNATLEKNIKQLVISNAELEQFAYVASHDLQEPLRMITSFLTLLEKKYRDIIDDKGKQYIDFAVDGGRRMRQIILDLLEFSRVGRTEDKIENVDLNDVVNNILSLQRQQIQEVHAVVKVEKLPSLLTYKTPMRQVFQNLINNGLKYHRAGVAAEISISVSSAGNFWQFAISDNGIGIGEPYLDKIFIIFQRLHNTEKYTGTGIGLPIAKKIIESLGGNIRVESEEGKGSTFYFTLPKEL